MATPGPYVPFPFHYSSDLDLPVSVYVSCVERTNLETLFPNDGVDHAAAQHGEGMNVADGALELYVTAQVVSGGVALHSVASSTLFPKRVDAVAVHWDEWLRLPVKYRDLPRTAQLVCRRSCKLGQH